MTAHGKYQVKMLGLLFLKFLFICGVGFSLMILVAGPLLRWAIHGVLYFGIGQPNLFLLGKVILGLSIVGSCVMWLEGKWKGRW